MDGVKKFLTVFFCITVSIMFLLGVVGIAGQIIGMVTFNGALSVLMEDTCMSWAAISGCFATVAAFIMSYLEHWKSND